MKGVRRLRRTTLAVLLMMCSDKILIEGAIGQEDQDLVKALQLVAAVNTAVALTSHHLGFNTFRTTE